MYKKKEILAFQTFGKKNLEQKCSVFFFIYWFPAVTSHFSLFSCEDTGQLCL